MPFWKKQKEKTLLRSGTDVEQARAIWKKVDAVILDIDCTLVKQSPLIELARFCKKEKAILRIGLDALLMKRAFKDSLKDCLNCMLPSKSVLMKFNNSRRLTFSPNVDVLVQCLQINSIPVYLVSGGLRSVIVPLAHHLNIPKENVFANKLEFFYDGDYAGFSEDNPLADENGKRAIAEMLKKTHGYKNLVNIGDGMTDYNCQGGSDVFIGYGGNVVREEIRNCAMWYITDFRELIEELKFRDTQEYRPDPCPESSSSYCQELFDEIFDEAVLESCEMSKREALLVLEHILNNL